LLVDLAANSRLRSVVEGLWAQIAVFQWAGSFRDHWTHAAIVRHRAIIAALRAGNVSGATVELHQHIEEVKQWVIDDLGAADVCLMTGAERSRCPVAAGAR
jgi:DNA-binding FadR family transcriptional regulator